MFKSVYDWLKTRPKQDSCISDKKLMSSKKIIRLKTPGKGSDSRTGEKLSQSTVVSGTEFNHQSTILLVKNVACSEELQVTLINEINKLYREISRLKHRYQEEWYGRQDAHKQNRALTTKLEGVEKEYRMFKQMYQLQKENHQRLRKFYELRQQQWIQIVQQHKKILRCYQKASNVQSQIPSFTQLQSMYTHIEHMLATSTLRPNANHNMSPPEKKDRKIRKNSVQREDSLSQPKVKAKAASGKQGDQREVSPLRQPSKLRDLSPLRGTNTTPVKDNNLRQVSPLRIDEKCKEKSSKASPRSPAEEFFTTMVRKTYCRYREKGISAYDIEQMEDMLKLKNAKTSTRERLAKTLRKLDFQFSSDADLRQLCQYVEKIVIQKYKLFRGDYAFEFLAQKIREFERIQEKQRGPVSKALLSIPQDSALYPKPSQLPIDSTIKDDKKEKPKIIDEDKTQANSFTPSTQSSQAFRQSRFLQFRSQKQKTKQQTQI